MKAWKDSVVFYFTCIRLEELQVTVDLSQGNLLVEFREQAEHGLLFVTLKGGRSFVLCSCRRFQTFTALQW